MKVRVVALPYVLLHGVTFRWQPSRGFSPSGGGLGDDVLMTGAYDR